MMRWWSRKKPSICTGGCVFRWKHVFQLMIDKLHQDCSQLATMKWGPPEDLPTHPPSISLLPVQDVPPGGHCKRNEKGCWGRIPGNCCWYVAKEYKIHSRHWHDPKQKSKTSWIKSVCLKPCYGFRKWVSIPLIAKLFNFQIFQCLHGEMRIKGSTRLPQAPVLPASPHVFLGG